MTTMDKVNKIKADIAALPEEYRALIVAEQTWVTAHPVAYGLALIAAGYLLSLITVWGIL